MQAVVSAVEVVGPIPVEVAIADDASELEDRLGSGQFPSRAGDFQTVAD
jgi:hypothetical protein